MTQFKDKAEKQQEQVSGRALHLPGADGGRRARLPRRRGARSATTNASIELMRDIAERFNARFGETLVVPEARIPHGRGADHGPAGTRPQDVDDRPAPPQGTVYVHRRARCDRQEVPLGRHRLGLARSAAARTSPGSRT